MNPMKRILSVVLPALLSVSVEARSCSPLLWRDEKPLVQIALLLDTSNSMDGLIEQAKSQLWRVANDLAYSSRCGERTQMEIALYEYGNDNLSPGENYVRQILPFTKDLDLVSQKLFALRTRGGQEYAGAVIKDAVQNLRWNSRDDVYKALFIAGNEPFTQGPVYFRDSIAQAARKGIRVNTIFCGGYSEGVQTQWQDGAMAGRGAYLTIDQNRAVVVDPTPYDNEIAQLGDRLNETYVAYGASGRRGRAMMNQTDQLAQSLPASSGAMLERSVMKASKQYAAPEWDIASRVAAGVTSAKELKAEELPGELQGKSDTELDDYFKKQHKTRENIQVRMGELKRQREDFLAKKKAGQAASGAATFDDAMRKAIREQASGQDFKFEK
jgi:hypothetical protein